MNSSMIVTEPLPGELWDEIGWEGHETLGDMAHAYMYAQRTADGRIAIGGRGVPYRYGSRTDVDRGRTQDADDRGALRSILTGFFPATATPRSAHVWSGVLGVPRDWCATVGLDPSTGLGWAGGYVGHGRDGDQPRRPHPARPDPAARHRADARCPGSAPRCEWEPEPLRWLGVHAMYDLYRRRRQGEGGTRPHLGAGPRRRLHHRTLKPPPDAGTAKTAEQRRKRRERRARREHDAKESHDLPARHPSGKRVNDILFRGGRVFLAADAFAEAVLVRDGRVAAVGAESDVVRLAVPGHEIVDLAGGLLTPGFTDAHVHAVLAGWSGPVRPVRGRRPPEYLARIRDYAAAHPDPVDHRRRLVHGGLPRRAADRGQPRRVVPTGRSSCPTATTTAPG